MKKLIFVLLVITLLTGCVNNKKEVEINEFKVTFNTEGGSNVKSINVKCGDTLKLPERPTKEGYEFVSWIDKNETPIYDDALLSCNDITLTAKWKGKTYNLKLNAAYRWEENGSGEEINLKENNKVTSDSWAKDAGGTTSNGTYRIDGNDLYIKMTSYIDITGEVVPLPDIKEEKYTITSDTSFETVFNGKTLKFKLK